MIATSPRRDSFTAYVRLLVELHQLIRQGKGDDEGAEIVRDQMDSPWRAMTADDLSLVDGLSEDLYTIEADTLPSTGSDKAVVESLLQLIEQGQFSAALSMCRENRNSISPPELAFARGLCWLRLDQSVIAVEFLREAVRLSPGEPTFEATLLVALHKGGFTDELIQRTKQHATRSADPLLALLSAQLTYSNSQDLAEHERPSGYQEVLASAKRAINLAKDSKADGVLDYLLGTVYLCVAMIYEELGQRDAAREACLDALRVNPDNRNAVLFLGWLDFEQFPESRHSHIRDRLRNLALSPGLPFETAAAVAAIERI